MKKVLILIFLCTCISTHILAKNEADSLLKVLDKTISERPVYTANKEIKIRELKQKISTRNSLEERYHIYKDIISEYESFLCDSAVAYIEKNILIAEQLNNQEYLHQSKLQLAFVLTLSGLFAQASELLDTIEYDELEDYLRVMYCWNYIRYYENLIKYTDDPKYSKAYIIKKDIFRNKVLSLLPQNTDMYEKERAFMLQENGEYKEARDILIKSFEKNEPGTHGYAMGAMSLARVYNHLEDRTAEEKYLIMAAITDTRLAVKENEALLSLAIYLYHRGDINRAYNYVKVALDDANFYNSRFRNTVISRVHPIIEDTYLLKIEQQKQNLRLYAILTSLFVIVLAIALYFIYRQIKIVSRARKSLRAANKKLDESNLIKEKYIGYFMNQCAVYIDKLYEYRKNIDRKVKTGQIEELRKFTSSTSSLDKDVEELYHTFDKAFFDIYPNFVDEFNSLLREDERYKLKKEQLNTELRIFALIRLGITDVSQIATFLRYSIQTIYNYKSKVKGKSLIDSDSFEEEVKKIGTFS
jgi:hypothetical protein